MMQNRWFKLFIWFMATFFFFLAAETVISVLKPGPTENEVMKFMMGMMDAMDRSIMGVAMNIENDAALQPIIALSVRITPLIIVVSSLVGFGIRLMQRRKDNV